MTNLQGWATLHGRIANHLGWSVEAVRSFSMLTLRELVKDSELKHEISYWVEKGKHIYGKE